MKPTWMLLLAGAAALLACTDTGTTAAPTGGSAGAMGPAYCESPPADPAALADWNRLCFPDR